MDSFHEQLTAYLYGYLTEARKKRLEDVIDLRTRYLTVVLEDVYKEQNASAVVRTCECLGVQDLHVIENNHRFGVNRNVVMGSSKWITIQKYDHNRNNTASCYAALRAGGYQLVAMSPHPRAPVLEEFEILRPTAFVFGTEYAGLSGDALNLADLTLRLPMYGFTESYNLSVTVAITLGHAIRKMRASKVKWNLTEHEKQDLRLDFVRKTVRSPDSLEKEFRKNYEPKE